MGNLVAPYPYFGGKRRIANVVWERLGNVNNFVEAFCGSAAVLLARPHHLVPYQVETINDLDGEVTNVWRAIQADPQGVIDGANWPVSELDLHAEARRIKGTRADFVEWLREDIGHYDAHRAGRWIWGQCCAIGANFDRAAQSLPALGSKGRGVTCHRAWSRPCRATVASMIKPLALRLRNVRVACGDWTRVLGPSVLWPCDTSGRTNICGVYLDPPYLEGNQQYAAGGTGTTLAHDVLAWCCQWAHEPTLRIALSGYSGHYDQLADEGWACVGWKATGGLRLGRRRPGPREQQARGRLV